MKIKIKESRIKEAIKKNLSEMAMDFETGDRPDPSIQQKVQTGDTPLKKVPMPDTGREPEQNFQELLASERYKQIVQRVRRYAGLNAQQTIQGSQPTLIRSAMEAQQHIIQIESQHTDELSDLAIKIVVKEMGIPEGSVQWDCKIERPNTEGFKHDQPGETNPPPVNPEEEPEEEPEEDPEEELELAGEMADFNLERAKRRLINAMIHGSAAKGQYMFHLVEPELTRITGDPTIINKYGLLMSVLDTQYWQYPDETIAGAAGESMDGKEEVDRTTEPPTIYARGTNFPILVHEIIKAVMELFSHQGEPENKEMFQEVMELEDTLEKETWDLRLGPPIWERIRSSFPDETILNENMYELQNWILVEIFKLPAKKFLVLTKEIMNKSPEGKRLVNEIYKAIQKLLRGEDDDDITQLFDDDLTDITNNTPDEEIVDFINTTLKQPGEGASEREWDAYLDQLAHQKPKQGNTNPEQQ